MKITRGGERSRKVCHGVLRRSGRDPAEVVVWCQEQALTRFAANAIHQNVTEHDWTVIVRILRGRRLGTAVINRVDESALDRVVERARTNADCSTEDPDYPSLPEPAAYIAVEAFDEATAECTPERRARAVREICRQAGAKALNASGAFATGTSAVAVANSEGTFAYHAGTAADFQTVIMTEDSSGRAQASAWRLGDIQVGSLAVEAMQQAEAGRGPRPAEPGQYTVVLSPYAVEDIVTMLNYYGMGAQSLLEGRSWMNDRLGQKCMSDLVDIWDDGLNPAGLPMPFDFEGVPKQRVSIVNRGVIQGPVHDRVTAKKMGQRSTGHALPPTLRSFGPLAANLFMASGAASTEEMVRSTDSGLYINRFWYSRLVHPRDCVITGMTRDGVFKIVGGELAYSLKNLRFTQSYVEALAEAEILGSDSRLLTNELGGSATRVPALKIRAFTFTGSTL